jgi:hypothetical protein
VIDLLELIIRLLPRINIKGKKHSGTIPFTRKKNFLPAQLKQFKEPKEKVKKMA